MSVAVLIGALRRIRADDRPDPSAPACCRTALAATNPAPSIPAPGGRVGGILVPLLIAVFVAMTPQYAGAASILVNTADDEDNSDGDCSLREAVFAANNNVPRDDCNAGNSGMDTITLLVNGTIRLSEDLVVTEALSVVGLGMDATEVSGGFRTRQFLVDLPDETHDFSISNVTLSDGRDSQTSRGGIDGGGSLAVINAVGALTIDSVRFLGNRTTAETELSSLGGAVLVDLDTGVDASITIRDSIFANNVSEAGGGALHARAEPGSTIDPLFVERSVFRFNAAGGPGGAIDASAVRFSIFDSAFEGSFASSGERFAQGGALNLRPSSGSLNFIERSSFVGNDGIDGGGALDLDDGITVIRNSTFHQNQAMDVSRGQAVRLSTGASIALFFSTFHDNGRGQAEDVAISACGSCDVQLTHSIVWSRWSPTADCSASILTSNGFNIDGSGTCTGHASDLPMTDPELLPLADYGGSVAGLVLPTLLPDPDSPAVDGGDSVCPGPLAGSTVQDQRGFDRPVFGPIRGNAPCDIGAVEFRQGPDSDVFDLSVSVGAGGRVFSDPAGIDCPEDCSMGAFDGFVIELAALADPGFEFVEWSGACSGTDRLDCDVTMNGPRSVTALFEPEGESIAVALDGNGTGSVFSSPAGIACPGNCEARFPFGTSVALSASPDAGSEFLNWFGDCTGSGTCEVLADADRTVTAVFGDGDLLFLDGFE